MENTDTFFSRNKAYIFTLLGLTIAGIIMGGFMMIFDWIYLLKFIIAMATGNGVDGVVTPATTHHQAMVNVAFGPEYNTIAPEFIRASNERQHFIWWVFVAEIAIFCFMYVKYGRKSAVITNPDDQVQVFSKFHRGVIWFNVAIIVLLVISGFNITWAMRSGGGEIPFFLRGLHEVTGLVWFPFWFLLTVIAFKDAKLLSSNSVLKKIILPGKYKPMKRIIYIVFVLMGAGLLTSGFIIWFLHPDAFTHGEFIQLKRLLLYVHFASSVLIMFFLMDFVYSVLISVKGNLKGLITGKFPREHLAQLAPDILADIESSKK